MSLISLTGVILLLAQSSPELPRDRWLCTGQAATGFEYDQASHSWRPTKFKPDGRFIIAALPVKSKTASFQWVIAPEGKAPIEGGFCGSEFAADTFLHCSGLGGTFTFNRRSQRYIHYSHGGYVSYAPGVNDITDESADTPFIEIGTCTKL
jgi:hypothetical protein